MITSSYFAVFVIFCLLPSQLAAQYRIVGGSATTIAKYPYMVYLRVNNNLQCGGSLIAPRFVLTAGHCIYRVSPRRMTIVAGTSDVTKSGVTRKVSKAILPKSYSTKSRNMDVGVLKMRSALSGPNIEVIPLCSTPLRAGNRIRVTGWGRLSETGGYPTKLRAVQVPLISRGRCTREYRSRATLTRSMFCAQSVGKDACSGDSGGPAVYNGQVCGVVSWGYGCARAGYSGVYTSVNYVKPFIRKALKR